ncbi:hypothetical protein [Paraburkholderia adhaesiva]|uniref:hypothetical protein n=1 Tax=Paraburkholderia adhaesiva TaxID=2883244 RepID=UPI001F27643C|nr:hypothetical protein [Paraburkholderia adhaesiva]
MWKARGTPVDPSKFGSLQIDEVLYEDDSPKLFTSHGHECALLVYESTFDRSEQLTRYLAVCADEALLSHVVDGSIALLDALDQQTVWAIDQRFNGEIESTVALQEGIHSVPDGYKPIPGVRLQADHHYN